MNTQLYMIPYRVCQKQCKEKDLVPVADVKMKVLEDYFKLFSHQISRHRLIYLLPFWTTDYPSGWRVESISLNQMSVSQLSLQRSLLALGLPSLLLWLPHQRLTLAVLPFRLPVPAVTPLACHYQTDLPSELDPCGPFVLSSAPLVLILAH